MDRTPEPVSKSSVDDFLDGLDELIGKKRPCPICGCVDWMASPNAVAFMAAEIRSADDLDTGSLHVAFLRCAQCRFLRMHLLPDVEPED
jgi:hypothetical protein